MQPLHDKHFTLSTSALVHMVQDARERTLALVADLEGAQFEVPQGATGNSFPSCSTTLPVRFPQFCANTPIINIRRDTMTCFAG